MQSIGICGLREEFSGLWDYFISDKVVYVADFFDSQFKVSRPLDSIDWLAKYDSGVVDLELKVFFFGNRNSYLDFVLTPVDPLMFGNIQRWDPPQKMLQEAAYHAWTGGFVCYWTHYVENGERYGITTVPILNESTEQPESTINCPECQWSAPADQAEPPVPCPQCGHPLTDENITDEEPIPVPEDGGEKEVPKGRQVIEIRGALNCKRPQHNQPPKPGSLLCDRGRDPLCDLARQLAQKSRRAQSRLELRSG